MSVLGDDVGGTFTDAVLLEDGWLRTAKEPTASNQEESVLAAARAVGAELRRRLPRAHVVASHEVAPEFREYERASTTAADAYLGPLVARYLRALADACRAEGLPEPLVMRSSGGVATVDEAAEHAALVLVSGPAAGAVGAARIAALAGVENAISFDMGGTSTDVCLIAGGRVERSAAREVSGFPIRLPSVDIHTVGAGCGSLAWRAGGGGCAVRARPGRERGATRSRPLVRVPAGRGRRAAARRRGGSPLPGPVARADGRARRRRRGGVPPRARGALRLCRPRTRRRA